ncbi:hypothetical protein PSY76_23565, partial [Shigella flexneri]|nr:hypothetical protein [Shigella flexneri]
RQISPYFFADASSENSSDVLPRWEQALHYCFRQNYQQKHADSSAENSSDLLPTGKHFTTVFGRTIRMFFLIVLPKT